MDKNSFGGWLHRWWDINPEEAVLIGRLGVRQVVSGGDFNDAFERSIINLHYQELASWRAAPVGALTADQQTIAFNRDFQVFPSHAGKLRLDHQAFFGGINIRVWNPIRLTASLSPAFWQALRIQGRVNFAHVYFRFDPKAGLQLVQAPLSAIQRGKFVQPENVYLPIELTLRPIVTFLRLVQDSNAESPITSTLSGMDTGETRISSMANFAVPFWGGARFGAGLAWGVAPRRPLVGFRLPITNGGLVSFASFACFVVE